MRVAVIGSGFGGLAAGIRLAALGHRVAVYEARFQAGGRAAPVIGGGYRFDGGPSIITAPNELADLLALAGRRLQDAIELREIDPFYEIRFADGSVLAVHRDRGRLAAAIDELAPGESRGLARFFDQTAALHAQAFDRLGARPFLRARDFAALIPAMAAMGALRSVYGLAASCFRDERLRMAFSFHPLFIGGDPFASPAVYALIPHLERAGGVHYALGGMGAVVGALVDALRALGGELQTGAPVERVLVRGGRVQGLRLAGGAEVAADAVVSNADAVATLTRLCPQARPWQKASWAALPAQPSMSCYLLRLGVSRRLDQLPHHTIFMPSDYRATVRSIFAGRLPRSLALYLERASATDPGVAPAGRDALYALVPVPCLGHRDGPEWPDAAVGLRARVLDFLGRQLGCAELGAHIDFSEEFTPLDFERQLGAWRGNAFSLQPLLRQSAYFRPPNRVPGAHGLYLVGAGTHPGAGIPGVLLSARIVAALIGPAVPAGPRRAPAPAPASAEGVGGDTLRDAFLRCRAICRRHARSFYLASRLLPRRARLETWAIYAYCRTVDDLADEPGAPWDPEEQLQLWRAWLRRLAAGEEPGTPPASGTAIGPALVQTLRRHDAAIAPLAELLDGTAWDLQGRAVETDEDLLRYCHLVAGTVGLAMAEVFGARGGEPARRAADELGIAMQLTNILRDVGEDARAGRVYLPLAALRRHGLQPEALRGSVPPPALVELVREYIACADAAYERARPGIECLPGSARRAVAAAAALYRHILRAIERNGCDVLSRRAHAAAVERALVLAGSLAHPQGGASLHRARRRVPAGLRR